MEKTSAIRLTTNLLLSTLPNPQKQELIKLTSILSQQNDRVQVTLQWIPAHCGIDGNESADILSEEHDKSVSYKDEKTIIKSFSKKLESKHPDFNPTDGYQSLDRAVCWLLA